MDPKSASQRDPRGSARPHRFAAYLGCVTAARDAGEEVLSSGTISDRTGVGPTQVRRDLSGEFGRTGKRGVGYRTEKLEELLRDRLLAGVRPRVLIVGRFAARMDGFRRLGFDALVISPWELDDFDHLEAVAGVIAPVGSGPDATPKAETVQGITDWLVACGVRVILNMNDVQVKAPPGVTVTSFRPEVELLGLLGPTR